MKKRKLNENRMGKWTLGVVIGVAVCIMMAFVTSARAAEPIEKDKWEFAVVPYLWGLSLDGNATVKGNKSDVDMSFSDIVSEINIGFMFDFEARKGRLGFFVNPLYAVLSGDQTISGVSTDVTADMFIGSFGVDYKLGPYALTDSSGNGTPTVTLLPYVGGRYTYMGLTINTDFRAAI